MTATVAVKTVSTGFPRGDLKWWGHGLSLMSYMYQTKKG